MHHSFDFSNRKSRLMRVGYLSQPGDTSTPSNPAGSIDLWTFEVARRLASSCEVLVCGRRHRGETASEIFEGVRYIRFPAFSSRTERYLSAVTRQLYRFHDARRPRFASSLHYLAYAVRAAQAFRANACDVVHIHNFSQFVPVVRRLNPHAKIVLHMNCDWLAQLDREMIDTRLGQADAILGCSEYVTGNIRARFPQYADRCATVFNAVDAKEFSPNGCGSNGSIGRRVVFVGRISPEKGLHVLLDAFERVAALRSDSSLEIIGPEWVAPMDFIIALSDDLRVQGLKRFYKKSSYLEYLRSRTHGPLQGRVSFVSRLPHSRLVQHLREADLFVQPSVWGEPFPLSVLESLAAGLPVVASRVGGLPEMVEDGRTGFLVEPDSPSALAEALLRLLNDRDLARAMGRAGRKRVEQMFSWESVADVLKARYVALCFGARTCNKDRGRRSNSS